MITPLHQLSANFIPCVVKHHVTHHVVKLKLENIYMYISWQDTTFNNTQSFHER